jgi:hypothetical protein
MSDYWPMWVVGAILTAVIGWAIWATATGEFGPEYFEADTPDGPVPCIIAGDAISCDWPDR